jgi:tRNA(Ile)-lysidine synthase
LEWDVLRFRTIGMKSKNAKLSLEHSVLRALKSLPIQNKKILVAVSGGVDSVVLLELLCLWQRYFSYELAIAHVHHGKTNRSQLAYRNRSQKFVRALAKKRNLPFFTNGILPGTKLTSENELRDFRWQHLKQWQKAWEAAFVAVAHHRDDLVETQILRLIRGTSRSGLKAMTHMDGKIIRPLLATSREQIEYYANGQLPYCEDPSNKNSTTMRNWLRQTWLPQLEKQAPGARKSLARSLEMIAQKPENSAHEAPGDIWTDGGVRRKTLTALTKKQQGLVVVEYLNRMGLKQFQQSHVNEILRRLDTRRKSSTFLLLGLSWTIHPDLIQASRV